MTTEAANPPSSTIEDVREDLVEALADAPPEDPPESSYWPQPRPGPRGNTFLDRIAEVNKELWLVLSMMVIAALLNYMVSGQRMVLGFYTLPTLYSAYFLGRRHATLTAVASIALVVLLALLNPRFLGDSGAGLLGLEAWYDIAVWGGILIITGYAMGTLHDRHRARIRDLHSTYRGLLIILRQFIGRDDYTENHCYRVSVYAARIGAQMGLSPERIEDLRSAALLHDIGKLEVSRKLLYKAASLSASEYEEMKSHVGHAEAMLQPLQGPLHRILPIILSHHEHYDGSGYGGTQAQHIPIEARVIGVADAYDALTSDRPYRKAMSPYDAKETIARESGSDFDPVVVDAFLTVFQRGEMEVPRILV